VDEEQKRTPEKAVLTAVAPPVVEVSKPKPKKAAAPEKCPSCHTPIPAERTQFSFCTHCGADLPKAGLTLETKPGVPPVRKPPVVNEEVLAHGVRDPRATVRKIAQVHAGTAQAQTVLKSQQSSSTQIEFEFRREINPTANAILSFIFPGLGQMLNGQVGKGILLILAAFVATTLIGMHFWGIEILIARVIVAIDAYRIGEKRRNGQKVADGDWDIA
jgi:TM2 domain-containing membrane protein YozV